jgi:NADH-quinone oxidoreductase subunit L
MESIVKYLWLMPTAPLVAAGVGALLPRRQRRLSAGLAIGAISFSFVLACVAFLATLHPGTAGLALQQPERATSNFRWFDFGTTSVQLGWVLDPLGAIMAVMVTLVSLLIFIYSLGYMAKDENFTRFFCFLALFAAAMLGLIIANSLLLFFICWELVGLASYLLIGFWFQKPSAAAAAKKAFIVTRIGDLGFLVGMLWLYDRSGTLLFYDGGQGCLDRAAAGTLVLYTLISLLIFCGAVGKSGQVPLHVWLPDAMEGPTPVSALIHAATMVAAGVFLIARVYPLMTPESLKVVTWVGALTAVFAASIAVAQNDIKRILAYSTVSQLGFMMMGLGAGGVAVGMFHLTTHAFFKALLFLGAGSVIHGCHEEQDIRRMGGLKVDMPLTFITYAIGMLALCGFPIFFSGFWSKDGILDAARSGAIKGPFYLLVFGALLTAFYMMRQVSYVFLGYWRGHGTAHESPQVMTVPLAILAFFAMTLGLIGTPAWPWFHAFLEGRAAAIHLHAFIEADFLTLLGISTVVVFLGLWLGLKFYGNKSPAADEPDVLEKAVPPVWAALRDRLYVDEFYGATVIAFYYWWARVTDWLDRQLWGGMVRAVAWLFGLWAQLNRLLDIYGVDGSFDKTCEELSTGGGILSRLESGRVQNYLRILAVAVVALAAILFWSSRP